MEGFSETIIQVHCRDNILLPFLHDLSSLCRSSCPTILNLPLLDTLTPTLQSLEQTVLLTLRYLGIHLVICPSNPYHLQHIRATSVQCFLGLLLCLVSHIVPRLLPRQFLSPNVPIVIFLRSNGSSSLIFVLPKNYF